MTRKRQSAPEVAIPVNTSYRGFRTRDGKWTVHKGCQEFLRQYAGDAVGEVSGPWRWGPKQPFARLLSWALLMDVFDDEEFVGSMCDEFNRQFTGHFHPSGWMMSAENIRAAALRIAADLERDPRRKPK